MERIIGRMYVEIHGNPPETPNGTSDTPRMRNRRRRRQLVSKGDTKDEQWDEEGEEEEDSNELHYDASSEWILSEASDEELNTLRSNDKDDDGDDDGEEEETVTVKRKSNISLENSNENETECKCTEEPARKEPTSPPIEQTLSVDCMQTVSSDCQKFSSPDCQQKIYVECERRPKATEPKQEQEQSDNNENQDESQTLLYNRITENRDTPEIEEELRRCFSGRCFSVDIGEEPDMSANRLGSSCTDDMNMPYLDQYREEILQRVKNSPTGNNNIDGCCWFVVFKGDAFLV